MRRSPPCDESSLRTELPRCRLGCRPTYLASWASPSSWRSRPATPAPARLRRGRGRGVRERAGTPLCPSLRQCLHWSPGEGRSGTHLTSSKPCTLPKAGGSPGGETTSARMAAAAPLATGRPGPQAGRVPGRAEHAVADGPPRWDHSRPVVAVGGELQGSPVSVAATRPPSRDSGGCIHRVTRFGPARRKSRANKRREE